uniref:Uncharacterized protein n=1 Tax=Brassica oleracea TaxID=3712 RepID=A0A3P6FRZ3_BRAOL|nr:unnamed protein product [Brassica oleracea]
MKKTNGHHCWLSSMTFTLYVLCLLFAPFLLFPVHLTSEPTVLLKELVLVDYPFPM